MLLEMRINNLYLRNHPECLVINYNHILQMSLEYNNWRYVDKAIDRHNINFINLDKIKELCGKVDLLPLWFAE